ncbi:hypothetical protein F4776DRAFT_291022 [Hypoxylon sp. NC0597]|nr:hypothetical protein F4776DRAFT_291022 [Hypoxylon sp. NC0597]
MPIPLIVSRRCGTCRRQKQKCTFTQQQDSCDRCLEMGFSCPPPRGTPRSEVPVRSPFKCDYCRKAHETCHPVGRAWPDRCEYCVARSLPCTAPRTKKDFNDSPAAQDGEGNISETNIESGPQRIENATIGVPSIETPLSEDSDFDDPTLFINALSIPRIKRVKSSAGETEPNIVEEVEKLRNTIRTMEDEFKEILKTEKENHQIEIRTLNHKHQEELNQQRERYEARIDDLIKIMRKM